MTIKTSAFALTALLGTTAMAAAECAEPIKVGVLHSLSGTMAISETTLKDTMLLLVEEQNAAGGLLDCQIETVVVD
ncbi:MAG: transporter substrate-binding protein, partial [Pseudomonadota bacterium]